MTPCYYCEEDKTACEFCIHGKAWVEDIRAGFKAQKGLAATEARAERAEAALRRICAIELDRYSHDWAEIEQAQDIASAVLAQIEKETGGE